MVWYEMVHGMVWTWYGVHTMDLVWFWYNMVWPGVHNGGNWYEWQRTGSSLQFTATHCQATLYICKMIWRNSNISTNFSSLSVCDVIIRRIFDCAIVHKYAHLHNWITIDYDCAAICTTRSRLITSEQNWCYTALDQNWLPSSQTGWKDGFAREEKNGNLVVGEVDYWKGGCGA